MTTNTDFFLIKDQNGGYHKINYADILFVKSVGNYLQFVTKEATITSYGSLQSLQSILEPDIRFMQIHRSFIVNLEKIEHISSDALLINKQKIPIGSKFLDEFKTGFIQLHLIKIWSVRQVIIEIARFA